MLSPVGARAAQEPTGPAPVPAAALDLAAMTLTPADLDAVGLDGFGLERGQRLSLRDEAANAAVARGGEPTEAEATAFAAPLRAAGYGERYLAALARADGDDPDRVALRVVSSVTAYADAAGAAAGFALLEDEAAMPTAADVAGAAPLGDRSELTRDRGTTPDLGEPFRSLDLTFQTGNLTAGVTVHDNADREPAVATVEALAARLLERIAAVRAGGSAGLAPRALRLADAPAPFPYEHEAYERRDGRTLPFLDETADDRAAREASYGDATDVYTVYQAVPAEDASPDDDPYYVARLLHFGDETAAATFLATAPVALVSDPGFYLTPGPVAGAPSLGDGSATLAYAFAASDVVTTRGFLVFARVGAVVARVQVDGDPEPPLAAVLGLAKAQVACLRAGACPNPALLPPALLGTVPPGSDGTEGPPAGDEGLFAAPTADPAGGEATPAAERDGGSATDGTGGPPGETQPGGDGTSGPDPTPASGG